MTEQIAKWTNCITSKNIDLISILAIWVGIVKSDDNRNAEAKYSNNALVISDFLNGRNPCNSLLSA